MKRNMKLVCAVLAASILCSSCIGSFPTFNKLAEWNRGISNSKFVNELIFICFHIIPVYEVAYLADGLIFNTIEFWGGDSGSVAKVGDTRHMKGSNGDMYAVTVTKTGYKLVNETRNCECKLVYDKKAKTWNAELDGTRYELMTMNDDGSLTLNIGGAKFTTMPNAQGVELAMQAASGTSYQYCD